MLDVIPSGLVTLVAFLVMLALLVLVHELGHFLTAVWLGIKVEEFGIGYPPRAWTLFERNGVKYIQGHSRIHRPYVHKMGDVLASKQAPDWMTVTSSDLSGRIINLPTRDQMEIPQFNEALIVEYYSR